MSALQPPPLADNAAALAGAVEGAAAQAYQQRAQALLLAGADAPAGLFTAATQGHWAVYLHAYRARLHAALRDNYGGLPRLMGDDAFDALAGAYIDAHPSRHPSIRWFGHQLAPFMRAHPEYTPHPALPDFAALEWALRGAFDAPDHAPLPAPAVQRLARGEWEPLVLELHPSVQCLDLEWAVGPVWNALAHSEDAQADEPDHHPHTLMVWRQGLQTRWMALDSAQAQVVRSIQAGATLGAVGQTLWEHAGESAAHTLAQTLQCLLQGECVCALREG